MPDIEKIQPLGSSDKYTLKARILTHTPDNTTTFLRGDNNWSNTLDGQMLATSFKINGNNTIYQAGGAELYGATPYIDFHFNNSTADHTNRIIEDASGELKIAGKLKVATSTNGYALNAASFICDSWIRTKGASGWYNETYGGGWYMSDDTWIRSSHSKRVVCDNHLLISTQNTGNAYNESGSALQIREVGWVGTAQSSWEYAPKIGFHWGGRAACQLGMDASQYLTLYQNNTTNGGYFKAGEFFAINQNGMRFAGGTGNTKAILLRNDGSNFWILCCNSTAAGNNWITPTVGGHPFRVELESGICYAAKLYGAVWNDYAEFRKDNPKEEQKAGRCVHEVGDGTLSLTTKRLERGCEIISDTFGFAIGEDKENGYNTPIASNGRVLAYPYESIEEFSKHIGWPVCSGPNGTVSIMTEEEEDKYSSRIIGTISEIPSYEEWGTGKVKVDGRVWIRIR